MAITHLQVVSVPVSDQDQAKAFYGDVLEFEVVTDAEWGDGQRWVELRPKGSRTSIALVSGGSTMAPGSLKGLVLNSDDVRADVDRLKRRGLAFTSDLVEDFWGRWAGFDDPDGNGWIISQGTPG